MFGLAQMPAPVSYTHLDVYKRQDAVEYAHSRGCILVAAAGNAGGDETYAGCYSYPASYDHVISVGAYGQDGLICGFSQHNDALDVVAPGEALTLVAAGSDGYVTDAGTSFACACLLYTSRCV